MSLCHSVYSWHILALVNIRFHFFFSSWFPGVGPGGGGQGEGLKRNGWIGNASPRSKICYVVDGHSSRSKQVTLTLVHDVT